MADLLYQTDISKMEFVDQMLRSALNHIRTMTKEERVVYFRKVENTNRLQAEYDELGCGFEGSE